MDPLRQQCPSPVAPSAVPRKLFRGASHGAFGPTPMPMPRRREGGPGVGIRSGSSPAASAKGLRVAPLGRCQGGTARARPGDGPSACLTGEGVRPAVAGLISVGMRRRAGPAFPPLHSPLATSMDEAALRSPSAVPAGGFAGPGSPCAPPRSLRPVRRSARALSRSKVRSSSFRAPAVSSAPRAAASEKCRRPGWWIRRPGVFDEPEILVQNEGMISEFSADAGR